VHKITPSTGTRVGGTRPSGGRVTVEKLGSGTTSPCEMDSTTLDVVIVSYNSASHLSALIASIEPAAGSLKLRVVIVDNGSADNSVEIARSLPGVEVIETGRNLGYSGAINVGVRHMGEYNALAVLNADVRLMPGSLERLVRALDDSVGIAVPRLLNPDGTSFAHLRREPSILGVMGDACFGSHWISRPRWLTDTLRRSEDYQHTRDVDWAGAAAWIVSGPCRREVGEWDSTNYFLYSEETDYARRARDAGFRVRFVPAAEVFHEGGGSGGSDTLTALSAVNAYRYFVRHHNRYASALFRAGIALTYLLRINRPGSWRALQSIGSRNTWGTLPTGDQGSAADG
jgi:N-acetylglucosaminyl-diphospho-decaprenol L-rhamnosyltransferase